MTGETLKTQARAGDDGGGSRPRGRGRSLSAGDLARRYMILVVWALVILIFSLLRPDTFPTSGNVQTIFASQAVLVVLTIGLLIPLTTGDLDLSVASMLALSAMLVAVLNVQHGWPIGYAILAALAMGLVNGAINGALVVLLDIDSLIVTLGNGTFLTGVTLWISDSNTVSGISNTLTDAIISYRLLGISLAFWYGLILCALLWYLLEYTSLGRRMLFVGRGRNVARLSGVRVGRIRWGALIAAGGVAALAGVVYAGTTSSADPSSGNAFLLPAFAAAFLGSTSILPGRFNAWGSFVAVYFLVTGITGFQLLGVDTFIQQLFYGAALVLAVALSQIVRRREVKEESAAG